MISKNYIFLTKNVVKLRAGRGTLWWLVKGARPKIQSLETFRVEAIAETLSVS